MGVPLENVFSKLMCERCRRWLVVLFLVAVLSTGAHATSSFDENKRLADKHYHDSPIEHWVAMHVGEIFPSVRDDLIARKVAGEGIVYRHLGAWATLPNWLDVRIYPDGTGPTEEEITTEEDAPAGET